MATTKQLKTASPNWVSPRRGKEEEGRGQIGEYAV